MASHASATNLLPEADEATRLAPSDPDVHYLRASLLTAAGELNEGLRAYERAATLRPLDYVFWLEVGSARDETGDTEGALVAFREAARLAPFYSQPRWQLGNLLLRANRRDEAFMEMRAAATTQPSLLPNFIDLVWSASEGDASLIERAIRPETDAWKLALARFFVKHGKTTEALALYRTMGAASLENRRALLAELLAAEKFPEAYEVWKSGKEENQNTPPDRGGIITDGSFEDASKVNSPGFGWQLLSNNNAVRLSLDQSEPRAGSGPNSLLVDWSGNPDAGVPVLSQLVLVDARTRYQLRFAFRTKDLSTGGPPILVINDTGSKTNTEIARSTPLPKNTDGWQEQKVEFTTGAQTRAILIKLIRQNCGGAQCPIFGRSWLDNFALQKL